MNRCGLDSDFTYGPCAESLRRFHDTGLHVRPAFFGYGVEGYRVEMDCSYRPQVDSISCSPCVFNWSVEAEFTQPIPRSVGA
jgi:hypothetical protein